MNLQELHENKKTVVVKRALREHFDVNFNFEKMTLQQTRSALNKIRGLLKEARSSKDIHRAHNNPTYLKLVMLEQGLVDRLDDLRNSQAKIIVENESVQSAQVLLAAQEMIDSLQKMLEDVSKMNVEELNAVTQGIKNEFGEDKGQQYNQAANAALTTLTQAIQSAKTALEQSQTAISPDGGAAMPASDMGMPDMDMGGEMPPEDDMGMGDEVPSPAPAQEPEDITSAGRERR
jgi:hypothetical protein